MSDTTLVVQPQRTTLRQGLINPNYLSRAATTLYVSGAAGSDATGDGTAAAPYATISKAASVLPAIIRHAYVIQVADGTYYEQVTVDATISTAGSLTIQGDTSNQADVVISGATAVAPTTASRQAAVWCRTRGGGAVTVQWLTVQYCTAAGIVGDRGCNLIVTRVTGTQCGPFGLVYTSGAPHVHLGNLTYTGKGPAVEAGYGVSIWGYADVALTGPLVLNAVTYGVGIGYYSQMLAGNYDITHANSGAVVAGTHTLHVQTHSHVHDADVIATNVDVVAYVINQSFCDLDTVTVDGCNTLLQADGGCWTDAPETLTETTALAGPRYIVAGGALIDATQDSSTGRWVNCPLGGAAFTPTVGTGGYAGELQYNASGELYLYAGGKWWKLAGTEVT